MRLSGVRAFAFDRPGVDRLDEGSMLYARQRRALANLRVVDAALDVWMLEHGYRRPTRIWMSDYGLRQCRARAFAAAEFRKRIAKNEANGKAGQRFHVEHAKHP